MTSQTPVEILLPFGLTAESLALMPICRDKPPVVLVVPSDFDEQLGASNGTFGEIFAIQVTLTLVRSNVSLSISWSSANAGKLIGSASTQPLIAVLISIEGAEHRLDKAAADAEFSKLLTTSRKSLSNYRLQFDLFSDRQIVLCTDSRGYSYPPDLYQKDARLRSREDFEGLIHDILVGQIPNQSESTEAYRFSSALGVIVAELFENTHIHGRFDLSGALLKPNAMRGLVFKRIKVELPATAILEGRTRTTTQIQDCLEISVFDTGVGYLQSFTREPLSDATTLEFEWKILHNCLERHHDPEIKDLRPSHRGMGLAEVLRALQQLQGRIEVRTGRLFAQRTFLPGELQAQMKPLSSPYAYRRQPIPKMLDYQKKYVGVPSQHDQVIGTAVRVIIPLM